MYLLVGSLQWKIIRKSRFFKSPDVKQNWQLPITVVWASDELCF